MNESIRHKKALEEREQKEQELKELDNSLSVLIPLMENSDDIRKIVRERKQQKEVLEKSLQELVIFINDYDKKEEVRKREIEKTEKKKQKKKQKNKKRKYKENEFFIKVAEIKKKQKRVADNHSIKPIINIFNNSSISQLEEKSTEFEGNVGNSDKEEEQIKNKKKKSEKETEKIEKKIASERARLKTIEEKYYILPTDDEETIITKAHDIFTKMNKKIKVFNEHSEEYGQMINEKVANIVPTDLKASKKGFAIINGQQIKVNEKGIKVDEGGFAIYIATGKKEVLPKYDMNKLRNIANKVNALVNDVSYNNINNYEMMEVNHRTDNMEKAIENLNEIYDTNIRLNQEDKIELYKVLAITKESDKNYDSGQTVMEFCNNRYPEDSILNAIGERQYGNRVLKMYEED